jgi:hypothetical protein
MYDSANSTTTALDGGASFTAPGSEVSNIIGVTVFVSADVAGTLYVECSADGSSWPISKAHQIEAGKAVEINEDISGRYFRTRYLNGASGQSSFELITTARNRVMPEAQPIDGNLPVVFGDTAALDAFHRLRVSEPEVLLDSKVIRGIKESLQWVEALTGGGTSTLDANRSTVKLEVSSSGDKVERQTRSRAIYQPGRSMLSRFTMIPPVGDANVRWRAGYFDANNGIFLQGVGDTYSWVIRSSVSGSPVDTVIAQADWNVDGLGASGNPRNPSGITFDWTKNVLAFVDLQWLALGRVRVGFDIDGAVVVHEFRHSNITTAPYMANPNLPVRYEIEATAAPGAARTLEAICAEVESEGGHNPQALTTPVSNYRTAVAVTDTPAEVIALRVKAAQVDKLVPIIKALSILGATASGNIYWALVLNPTGMSGGAWVSAGGDSGIEFNVGRGTGWGGRGNEEHMLVEGYFSGSQDSITLPIAKKFRAGTSVAGVADIISLQAANATAATGINMFAAILVDELF